ncbi:MAG: ABC transporter ATP-binding protein, partial [Clostridia bacterium]|nr:ABC transporter ATP-binding protein [Clostridia bacterium]
MPGPSPLPPGQYQYDRVPPPRSVRDLPRFLRQLLGGFFGRLFYTFGLVWKSGPAFLFLMSFVALFNGLMPLVGALLSKEILNELQGVITQTALGRVFDTAAFWGSMVLLLLIWFFIYKILSKVVNRLSHAINRIAGERVVRHVRICIMKKAQELDLAAYDLPGFYEKLENANREAGNRPISILNSTFEVISALISLVGYIVILAQAMPLATLIIIVMSIPSTVINFIYRRRTFSYIRRRSADRRQMSYFSDLAVNKDLAKEIRIFGLGDELIDRYDTVFQRYYKGLKSLIIRENVWQIVLAVLTAAVNCFFFATIALGVFRGDYQIGDYSLYTGALTSIASGVATLINTSATIYEGTLFIDNLLSFLREKPTVVPRTEQPALPTRGCAHTIELKNVGFTYPGADRPVLQNINLTLRPGETVALVGLNGAGKTTLIKLLTRLYDPTEGEILLDGKDLRDYDVKELYRLFGPIFQDFGKYAATAADNIRFGNLRREGTREDIAYAARRAGADSVVEKLENGYDTELTRMFDRKGTDLSGGEWQKISIARAFYSDADILILDEPTASLDPLAEQEIFRRFDELRGDKTAIFAVCFFSRGRYAHRSKVRGVGLSRSGFHRRRLRYSHRGCAGWNTPWAP